MFLRLSRKHYYSLSNQSDQFALRLNFLCRALRHEIDRTRCHRLRDQQRSSTAYFYGSASLTPLYNFLSLFQLMFILEKDPVLLFALCRRKTSMNQKLCYQRFCITNNLISITRLWSTLLSLSASTTTSRPSSFFCEVSCIFLQKVQPLLFYTCESI